MACVSNSTSLTPRANVVAIATIFITNGIAGVLVILDNWLLEDAKVGALEDSWWECFGILNGVASVSYSTCLAP